jgi:hypothetical protein
MVTTKTYLILDFYFQLFTFNYLTSSLWPTFFLVFHNENWEKGWPQSICCRFELSHRRIVTMQIIHRRFAVEGF